MSVFSKKRDRADKFQKATKGKSESEKREAEEALLQPEPLPEYQGELPVHKNDLDARTVLIVFRNKAQMDLVGEIFSIRTSVANKSYITDISLLEYISKQVKKGKMKVVNGQIMPVEKKKGKKKRKLRK